MTTVNRTQVRLSIFDWSYQPGITRYQIRFFESVAKLSRIFAIEFAERLFGLLPKGTHDWEKFVTGRVL